MDYLHIPKSVWGLPDLDLLERAILATVLAYESNNKRCHMTNEQLATEFRVSESSVKRSLNALQDAGFLKSETTRKDINRVTRILSTSGQIDPISPTSGQIDPIDGVRLNPTSGQIDPIDGVRLNLNTKTNTKIDTKRRERADAPLPPVDNFSVPEIDLKNQGSKADKQQPVTKLTEQYLEQRFGHDRELCDNLKTWLQKNRANRKTIFVDQLERYVEELGGRLHAVAEAGAQRGWYELRDHDSLRRESDQQHATTMPQAAPIQPATEGGRAYEALRVALVARDQPGLNQAGLDFPIIKPVLERLGGQSWVLQRIATLTGASAHGAKQEFISTYNQLQKEL